MSIHFSKKSYRVAMKSGEKIGGLLRSLVAGIPWSECGEGEDRFVLEAPLKNMVHIHNTDGRTAIMGESREDIEIIASKQARAECQESVAEMIENMAVKSEYLADCLEIDVEIPRQWNRHGRIDLMIRIPNHIQLEIASSSGKVLVSGMRAAVRARSANGSVGIRDVMGNLHLTTANAKLCCIHTCGRLTARSSNGKIELSDHTGGIDASTSNGSIKASLAKLAGEGVMLATSNGRIELDLPSSVDAEIDVRVDNGVIQNNRSGDPGLTESAGRIRGKLGRGGPTIKLRTSNGTVSIH